jgi:hypothetical protein
MKFCIPEGLLDEQPPSFVMIETLGRGAREGASELRIVKVSLVPQVKQGW